MTAQLHCSVKVLDVPVVVQRQVPASSIIHSIADSPLFHFITRKPLRAFAAASSLYSSSQRMCWLLGRLATYCFSGTSSSHGILDCSFSSVFLKRHFDAVGEPDTPVVRWRQSWLTAVRICLQNPPGESELCVQRIDTASDQNRSQRLSRIPSQSTPKRVRCAAVLFQPARSMYVVRNGVPFVLLCHRDMMRAARRRPIDQGKSEL